MCLYLLLAGSLSFLSAQVRSEYDRFSNPGSRANAMGDAVVSDARDLSIMYRNPAGLVLLQRASFFMDHQQDMSGSLMSESIGFLLLTGERSRVAAGMTIEHRGSLTSPDNEEIRTRRVRLDVTQALWIVPALSIGLNARVTYAGQNEFQHWGLNTIFGMQYAPGPEVSYALTLRGLGTTISRTASNPTEGHTGSNPKVLQVGMTLRFPSGYSQHAFILALANAKEFGVPGLTYRAGIEYFPARFLALRGGLIAGPTSKGASFGAGVQLGRIHLDAGAYPANHSGRLYQASIILEF